MVKVFEGTPEEFYMDGYLFNNLSKARSIVRDDWDFVWVVDGGERKGKSVFAQQVAKFVSHSFCLDNIVFTPEQFEEAVLKAEPFSSIVYDEAYGGLGSRSTMSRVNRSLVKMLTEIGFRNLFIIIVLPTFFDLDKYVALWRSRALFHIYIDDDWRRGFFCAYNEETKKDLYVMGKKFMSYKVVKPNFYGRFTNRWLVDKDSYNKKKREAQLSFDKKKDVEGLEEEVFNRLLFERLVNNINLSHKDRISVLGIPEPTYYRKLRDYRKEGV